MHLPIKDTLTKKDFSKWAKDLINYFVVPVLIVFLSTLQTADLKLALGAAYGTGLACAINLLGKYRSGIDPKDLSNLQKMDVSNPIVPNPLEPQQ